MAKAAPGVRSRSRAWAGYAACAWAALFAAPHVWWVFGIRAAWPGDDESYRAAFRNPWFLAYDLLVVVLCAVGAWVALATVRPWSRAAPRRLVLVLAWLGCALLASRGVAGLVADGRADLVWWPTFLVGGVLFGLAARRYQRGSRDRHIGAGSAEGSGRGYDDR